VYEVERGNDMTIQIENNKILDFVEYVDSFYNPATGIYPITGATVEVITKAIKTYIAGVSESEAIYQEGFVGQTWGGGDTVDRERVRDLILENPECEVVE